MGPSRLFSLDRAFPKKGQTIPMLLE